MVELAAIWAFTLFVVFPTWTGCAKGECVHEGKIFQVGASWNTQDCRLQCFCNGSSPDCQPLSCVDPGCDFSRELLSFPKGESCCPTCGFQSVHCKYREEFIEEGAEWSTSPCQTCICKLGIVSCTTHDCPSLHCVPGYVSVQLRDECCPQCISDKDRCTVDGFLYKHEDTWVPVDCTVCQCNNGVEVCYIASCPALVCAQDEFLKHVHCCPECVKYQCQKDGLSYEEGEIWWLDPCTFCTCSHSNVVCHQQNCSLQNTCLQGGNNIGKEDTCCSTCVSTPGACINNGKVYADGEIWKSNKCDYCMCRSGIIHCQSIKCLVPKCLKGETLIQKPDKCCLECVTSYSNCISEQGTHKNGSIWKKDACSLCMCNDGKITCYSERCSHCNDSEILIQDPGKCCPLCVLNSCGPGCRSCLQSKFEYCTACIVGHHFLHDGKCTSKCKEGYYGDARRHCKSCHPSCKKCFGGLKSQCLSCRKGRFLRKGSCVDDCGFNFFAEGRKCMECHPSCSFCDGPNENNCLSCKLPGQLLENGRCTDSCKGHSYVSEGNCFPCNSTCAKCLADGSCLFCPENLYLEDGHCIPDCSSSHYTFMDAYCLLCHPRCLQCDGPHPFQCTVCSYSEFLLVDGKQSSCVTDCGQGYYRDQGAGVCMPCHPECRSCLGGADNNECLSCANGYLLPHPGTSYGKCVKKCPAQHFLAETGICHECHEMCKSCFGPNDCDCLSCNATYYLKNGKCVPHCSVGYFVEDETCHACHPSCSTCYGWGVDECYTCIDDRTLRHGRCITDCKTGELMDSSGMCQRCHSTCSACIVNMTSNMSLCVECKHQQHYILDDECISDCEKNYFINSYHVCEACHNSCASCERAGASGCASCWNGSVLTHVGTCSAHCHTGYYAKDGICQACESTCYHCIGEGRCIQCKGELVLQFGECVPKCLEQHFIDPTTHQCRECHWECNTCIGPSSSNCTSCMPGTLLQTGECVKNCDEEYYQKGKECILCDLKCKTCSNSSNCTSCETPLLLLNNECVADCGSGKFPDFSTLNCLSCPNNCAFCIVPYECILCEAGFYFQHPHCISHCPKNYFADPLWRTCEENIHPPHILVNNSIFVEAGSLISINTSFLNAVDEDTDVQNLVFRIIEKPENGAFIKVSENGQEITLVKGHTFTIRDLTDGRIFLRHFGQVPIFGQLIIKVMDRQLESPSTVIPFQVISPYPPVIFQKKPFVVKGSFEVMEPEVLNVFDWDNIDNVHLRIIKGPFRGAFVEVGSEKPISKITANEILQGKVAYKSMKRNKNFQDIVIFQATDGYHFNLEMLKIFVISQDSKGPVLITNRPAYVSAGGSTPISSQNLLSVGKGLDPSDILFVFEPFSKTNIKGYFFKRKELNGILSETGSMEKIVKFTMDDINRNFISFQHIDLYTMNITLKFTVVNINDHYAHSVKYDFEIRVLNTEFVPHLHQHSKKFGMMVLENHPATILNSHLPTMFSGLDAKNVLYTITRQLMPDEGSIEHEDNPGVPITSFTQLDIENLKIVYRPPENPIPNEKQYFFHFLVSDHQSDIQLHPEQVFTISVVSMSSTASELSPDYETSIVADQGHFVHLSPNALSTEGHEIPEDQLEVILTIAPLHGILVHGVGPDKTELVEGDAFDFTSTVNDLYYFNGGSNNWKDKIEFTIMGGNHHTRNRLNIEIKPIDMESPVILDSTTLMGSVVEGELFIIERHHLAYTDLISDDSEIVFTLLNALKYGNLERFVSGKYEVLKPKSTFLQRDINDLMMRYKAKNDIGLDTVREFVYLNVSDGNGNVQPNQVFTIKIKPRVRVPPIVTILRDMVVEEGSDALFDSKIISVFDPDSSTSAMFVIVDKQPEYGFIENSRPIPGAERSLEGIPVSSFTFIDVLEGFIKYKQSSHFDMEPNWDSFDIHINDSHLTSFSNQVNITIKPTNDEEPVILIKPMLVPRGGMSKITNSTLSAFDADSSLHSLLFTLETTPVKGHIRKLRIPKSNIQNGKIILEKGNFTSQDIASGSILYVHDKPKEVINDSFQVSVSDGLYSSYGVMDVIIFESDREAPYVDRNHGLEIQAGNTGVITNKVLHASDTDSNEDTLMYELSSNPKAGTLFLVKNGSTMPLSVNGPVDTFSQVDIDLGSIIYVHGEKNSTGADFFKFNIRDPVGNAIIDQKFIITVFDNLLPPVVTNNTGISVAEGTSCFITTNHLYVEDRDSQQEDLIFYVISSPTLGRLELVESKGVEVKQFKIFDLIRRNLYYVHTSETEDILDSFTFDVSDGKNQVTQAFYITIIPVDDALPHVTVKHLKVVEGSHKVISEFELKIQDSDTKDSSITIDVKTPPSYGVLLYDSDNGGNFSVSHFTMEDIYQSKISYLHDGSDTVKDSFKFFVSDGTNSQFVFINKNNATMNRPIVFQIDILPVDDGVPVLMINNGLQYLITGGQQYWREISNMSLLTKDIDTSPGRLVYTITKQPEFGALELKSDPDTRLSSFTQRDINEGLLKYVLKIEDTYTVEDSFTFDVEDSRPVLIKGNVFHISWSRLHFEGSSYNISERERLLNIKVMRTGYTDVKSHVKCDILTLLPRKTVVPLEDIELSTSQVIFETGEKEKFCSMMIIDDDFYEGQETFIVLLSNPFYALLGSPSSAVITIYDDEDEPTIEFQKTTYYVNETQKHFPVPVLRKGDLSKHVAAMCLTSSHTAKGNSQKGLETGSDFQTRFLSDASEITFPPGVEQTACDIMIIDDSFYEEEEDFELILSNPFPNAKIGNGSKARIIILGPNDVPHVHFSSNKYKFEENVGSVTLEIIRSGPDISQLCIVWCGARLSSESLAIPGQDFLPSSIQITFQRQQSSAECPITILDDISDPKVEGNKEFIVFLKSPIGCALGEHSIAVVTIEDESDVPCMQFIVSNMTVREISGKINVPIIRTGDLDKSSAVRCITKEDTATVDEDFSERINTDASIIIFLPGEKETFCSVNIIDDVVFEGSEHFHLKLVEAYLNISHRARIGSVSIITVEITDKEDAVVIELEKPLYVIKRPNSPLPEKLTIKVVRKGDLNHVSKVRVSTQDGSAVSGIDYHAKSKVLEFYEGDAVQEFEIEVLYNQRRKWNLSFSVILSSYELMNVELGNITRTSVTISDDQSTGSWILPAVPLVVSLQYYDNVEQGIKVRPSPGYPVVCVTPCDTKYPDYVITGPLCKEAGINLQDLYFSWEIAMPLDNDGRTSLFETVTDSTIFTSAHHVVLDSIYFRRHEYVRCLVQPRDVRGNLGVPLRSSEVQISFSNGLCDTPLISSYSHPVLQSQSFVASLNYINPANKEHPNKIHIHVEIPHQDGMLPLISTFPLQNIRFLLTQGIYKQQHTCSNLLFSILKNAEYSGNGFLKSFDSQSLPVGVGYNLPYQFDAGLRENKTLLLYQHLNLKSCTWKFDAWYHMTEITGLCGGTTTADFKTRDSDQTFVTVHLPLHVSYIFAAAPTGWTTVEHRTEMEFSFFYNAVQWHTGVQVEDKLSATLQVLRLGINSIGQMYFEFKTEAKFRGIYVLEHNTLPGIKSHIVPPVNLAIHFDLSLLWSEETFDGPSQLWKAVSKYNLKDYSGLYEIMLVPCKVMATQLYSRFSNSSNIPCMAQLPQRFEIPLSFQQTSRPVPVMYSLNTIFQLLNEEKYFFLDPSENSESIQYMDYKGTFAKGQTIYGRVLWSPDQNLESAYQLKIQKVIICTGIDGYTPTYDPTGETYGEGPQYGCIQQHKSLKHKFIILDRNNPDEIDQGYHDVLFEAKFSGDDPTSTLAFLHGIDGFQFKVDALYEVNSGYQWFLQVMYIIGPSNSRFSRLRQRSLLSHDNQHTFVTSTVNSLTENGKGMLKTGINGTNIQAVLLDVTDAVPTNSPKGGYTEDNFSKRTVHVVFLMLLIAVVLILIFLFLVRRHKVLVQKEEYENENQKNSKKLLNYKNIFIGHSSCKDHRSEVILNRTNQCNRFCRIKLTPTKSEIPHNDDYIGTEV